MSDLQLLTSTLMTGTEQVSETLAASPPMMWLTGRGQFSQFVHCESLKFHLSQDNFFSMFKLFGHILPSTIRVVNIKSVSLQICILSIEESKTRAFSTGNTSSPLHHDRNSGNGIHHYSQSVFMNSGTS